jgi:FAD/FMN-containing dehydrogenase
MSDFAAFKDAFLGDLVVATDPDYDKAIARWAISAARRAKVVAFVKGTADVALAINYAKENKLPIAVRGGGHSPYGASSSEGGLVIDLSRYLNEARVDPEEKLVYVGGGAVWETVDKAAIKHGLATVGGTVNHVRMHTDPCLKTRSSSWYVDRCWRVCFITASSVIRF